MFVIPPPGIALLYHRLSLQLCMVVLDTLFLHLAMSSAIEQFSTNRTARSVRRVMMDNNNKINSAMEVHGHPDERRITHDLIGIPLAVFLLTEEQSRKADHNHIIMCTSNRYYGDTTNFLPLNGVG